MVICEISEGMSFVSFCSGCLPSLKVTFSWGHGPGNHFVWIFLCGFSPNVGVMPLFFMRHFKVLIII